MTTSPTSNTLDWPDYHYRPISPPSSSSDSSSISNHLLIVLPALGQSCTPYIHFPHPWLHNTKVAFLALTPLLRVPYLSTSLQGEQQMNQDDNDNEDESEDEEYFQWYDTFDLDNGEVYPYSHPKVLTTLSKTRSRLHKLLDQLCQPPFSFSPECISLLGFGQGGLVALDVGLQYTECLHGIVSVGGAVLPHSIHVAKQSRMLRMLIYTAMSMESLDCELIHRAKTVLPKLQVREFDSPSPSHGKESSLSIPQKQQERRQSWILRSKQDWQPILDFLNI